MTKKEILASLTPGRKITLVRETVCGLETTGHRALNLPRTIHKVNTVDIILEHNGKKSWLRIPKAKDILFFDNNGDGDCTDEDDYTEDLNRDGNLDLGVSGDDELYFDYDGDGNYDPQVGGQEIDLDECIYPGADGIVSLRPGQFYELVFSVDDDGDGERAVDGSIPASAQAPVSLFGSLKGATPSRALKACLRV